MSVRGRPEQRDANEGAIVEALEAHGWVVERVSSADFPDLVCLRRGEVRPIEVKSEGDARMRKGQVELHQRWERSGHPIPIVSTVEEAVAVLEGTRMKRTYRDLPWRGVTALEKARRLQVKL